MSYAHITVMAPNCFSRGIYIKYIGIFDVSNTAVVMAGVERVIAAPLVSVDSTGSRERITDTRVDMAFIQPGNCHQTDELWTTVVYRFVGAGCCCWDGEKTQISVVNQVLPPFVIKAKSF